jgi:hypothetical protein
MARAGFDLGPFAASVSWPTILVVKSIAASVSWLGQWRRCLESELFRVASFGCCEWWRCVRECRKGRSKGFCSDPPNCCQHGQQGMCLGTSYPEAVANSFVAIYLSRSSTRMIKIVYKNDQQLCIRADQQRCLSARAAQVHVKSNNRSVSVISYYPFYFLQHTSSRTTLALPDSPTGLWGQTDALLR